MRALNLHISTVTPHKCCIFIAGLEFTLVHHAVHRKQLETIFFYHLSQLKQLRIFLGVCNKGKLIHRYIIPGDGIRILSRAFCLGIEGSIKILHLIFFQIRKRNRRQSFFLTIFHIGIISTQRSPMMVGVIVDILITVLFECLCKIDHFKAIIRLRQGIVDLLHILFLICNRQSVWNLIRQNRIGVWHDGQSHILVIHFQKSPNISHTSVKGAFCHNIGSGGAWFFFYNLELFHQVAVFSINNTMTFGSSQCHISGCLHCDPVIALDKLIVDVFYILIAEGSVRKALPAESWFLLENRIFKLGIVSVRIKGIDKKHPQDKSKKQNCHWIF